jgi:hypothetical protein
MYNASPLSKFSESWQKAQALLGKDNHARAALEEALKEVLTALRFDPSLGELEPIGMQLPQGIEFRKQKFKSGFGALGQWRLLYFWDTNKQIIYWLWLYSHKQYPIRPTREELKQSIETGLEEM